MRNNDIQATISERWRDRISKAKILERLLKHYAGLLDPPLDQGQITIGLKLVSKIMPDLKSVDVSGRIEHIHMSRLELEGRLVALGRDPNEVWQSLEKRHKIQALALNGKGAIDSVSTAHDTQDVDIIEEHGTG
jgi:hypothetical protein